MSVMSTTRRSRLGATVDAESFKRALDRVQPAVDARSSVPACRGVLVESADGRLNITATELGLTIRTRIAADTWSCGAVVVPFGPLHSIASHLFGELALELSVDGRLLLDRGMRAALPCQPASDFPATPRLLRGRSVPLDVRALRDVLPAAKARASGVLLDGKDVVAGDAEHLQIAPTSRPIPRCHLPRSAAAAIAQAAGTQLRVRVDGAARRAQFVTPDTSYIVGVLDAPALDPRDLIEADAERSIVATAAAKDFLRALAQLRALQTRSGPAPVWLAVEADQVVLTTSVPDVAAGAVAVPAVVEGIDGQPLDVPFHPSRLAACVAAAHSRQVSIHLRDAHTSAAVTGNGPDGRSGRPGVRFLAPAREALTIAPVIAGAQMGANAPGQAAVDDNVVSIEYGRSRLSTPAKKGRR